ncbi:response regulator [Sphingomonas sp. PAMC 26621]|uniref:response regulator n=1 Tax=Sphingomonas sp. PAMC 26621 TaxID=1112213 RepID=UPI0002892FC8|nr:response regulator [Sphingomonas sp. PAMC 26621]
MFQFKERSFQPGIGVSLVDGDSAVRHARQLMLLSEGYNVRSYATCAALLADPRARDYPCIILDFEMGHIDGLELLRQMRANGWHGKALLLDVPTSASLMLQQAEQHGDKVSFRNVGNKALLTAIASLVG